MQQTYLTTEGLSERIHYDQRTIRERAPLLRQKTHGAHYQWNHYRK